MQYIIGVDIGTTSTKAIAFDLEGKLIAKKSIEYPIINVKHTWSEQNPEEIFNAVVESVKSVVEFNKSLNNELLAVSFSSAMHSVIVMDEGGYALTNSITWADTRSSMYAVTLKETGLGHEIYMKTGTPIHPMSPLCKIAWIRDNMKQVFNKAHKFISIKEYIFYKLFNCYIVDYSIASATGMFDIYKLKWNEAALNFAGIDASKLSEPVSTLHKIAGLNDLYSSYMGIEKHTPFIVGASDGCAANLGANAIKEGTAAVTIGTSGAIRVICDKPICDEKERIFSYILDNNKFVLGGPINNGGVILRWFKVSFCQFEEEKAVNENTDIYDLLMKEAEKVSAGSEGLLFLPYLLGERAPHWDSNSKGVYFGINIKHKKEHFLRALLEGIIYGIYDIGKALTETIGNIDRIYATGGFAKSELWLQILADVFNREVILADSYESSCLGVVFLAMKALNIIDNIEEIEKFTAISKVIYPNKENHEVYSKAFKTYSRLYEKLKDEFQELQNNALNI